MPKSASKSLLLIGASRGLGCALAEEYLNRGWNVVATVRGASKTKLHELLERGDGRLEIETVPDEVSALQQRLVGRKFQLLFVNVGVVNQDDLGITAVSTDEFMRVMVTNALSPLRVVESLKNLVVGEGTIGVMSSGQGSVANNENGYMRCIAPAKRRSTRRCEVFQPGKPVAGRFYLWRQAG